MLVIWVFLSAVFLICSHWLLITLLLLEIITFYILFIVSFYLSAFMLSDILVLLIFRVFVIEGVIGLAGLIILVSFTGSDYIRSSSIIKC